MEREGSFRENCSILCTAEFFLFQIADKPLLLGTVHSQSPHCSSATCEFFVKMYYNIIIENFYRRPGAVMGIQENARITNSSWTGMVKVTQSAHRPLPPPEPTIINTTSTRGPFQPSSTQRTNQFLAGVGKKKKSKPKSPGLDLLITYECVKKRKKKENHHVRENAPPTQTQYPSFRRGYDMINKGKKKTHHQRLKWRVAEYSIPGEASQLSTWIDPQNPPSDGCQSSSAGAALVHLPLERDQSCGRGGSSARWGNNPTGRLRTCRPRRTDTLNDPKERMKKIFK
ncbi:hypothetical protein HOY82DRAFT_50451 [Tuber indicum]|nr:hypothetical protein HOY82DRAFT_50451 [Tuber indicum]